jgi:ABC-type transporter Mla subunit MlaD
MDFGKLIDTLKSHMDEVESVIGLVVPGGKTTVDAIAKVTGLAGTAVKVIDAAKETLGSDAAQLDATRDALEARVRAHAKRVSDMLG